MLMNAVEILNIGQIDYHLPESEHTPMEVDSMHACIERAANKVDIFIPRYWSLLAALLQ